MVSINLLPWRAQRRAQAKKRVVFSLVGSILVSLMLIFLMKYYVIQLVQNQLTRNHFLNSEMSTLDRQINVIKSLSTEKDRLISKLAVFNKLQMIRVRIAYLFVKLSHLVPEEITLNKMAGSNDTIFLKGHAKAQSDVYSLLQRMEKNQWIHQVTLTEIKLQNEQHIDYEFKLKFNLRYIQ